MNTELIIFIAGISIISLVIGIFLTAMLLPNFLKSAFRDTAREELDDIAREVKDEQEKNEDDITKSIRELDRSLTDAKAVWSTSTKNISEGFNELNRSFIAWEESLSNPGEQGALAEEALQVMLETAGLVKGVNFETQITEKKDGTTLRPDFYVYTPDGGVIVIDSKAPMRHYKEAIKADSEIEKKEKLKQHANNMLAYANQLGKKDYTKATGKATPDVVIMYVPNIAIYLAACNDKPDLIQQAWNHKVTICPPEAVYPVLKNVMLSWQQKKLYENAELIQKQTMLIHDRLKIFQSHFSGVGKALSSAKKAFNKGASSWDSRLIPAFRKIEEMGIADKSRELDEVPMIEETTVQIDESDRSETES
jgi:DNA recombination protein RmuC